MPEKKCNKCGKIKPIEDFVKSKKHKDGYRNECKKCRNLYYKERFKNKECTTVENARVCKKCKKRKNLTEFAKNKTKSLDGYLKVCKDCNNAYYREYYHKKENKNKHIKRVYKNKKQYRDNFSKYKKSLGGCKICGYNKSHHALHFHHLEPKNKSFSINLGVRSSFSIEKIEEELKKCILVCANCHAEIEAGITQIPQNLLDKL